MKALNTISNRGILLTCLLFIALILQLTAQSPTGKTWCSDLYVGDIRVPQEQRFFFFRRGVRNNIAAILKDINGCSVIERNKGLESLLERESQFFNDNTYNKIIDYTDQFKRKIRWVVLGQLTPTMERNEYELEVRIIRAASRVSEKGFIYVFSIDEDYDQQVFNRNFKTKFLEEMDQMFTFTGYINSQSNITKRNFRIVPTPEHNSLNLDLETGSFEFKIPKYKFEYDTLSIEILGRNIYGTLGSSPAIDHKTTSNTIRVNRIDVGRTTGQVIDMIWDKRPTQCDDFRVRKVSLFSADASLSQDSVSISKTSNGFRLDLAAGLPNDTEVQVDIFSLNYQGYQNPRRFSLNTVPDKLMAGTYTPSLIRKFIPGLHQWNHNPRLLSPLIILAQAGTLWAHFDAIAKANEQKRDAAISTSFLTRQQLLNSASKNEDVATAALIAALATYAFHWFHALFLKPCRNPTRTSQSILSATVSAGIPTFSLSIPIS